jgi:multiple sugar transport system substrate-binding protein
MFVWGRASIIENAISAIRTMEKHNPALARKAAVAPPAEGPKGRRSAAAVIHCYVIWRFSPQAELARRFLVDLVGASEQALQASEFHNCPAFAGAVKNFSGKLAAEKVAPGRYRLLGEAERWSGWPGYPGYTTPAIEETVQRAVVPRMFARAVRGEQSAEDAVKQAEAEMKRIFARWAR